MKILIIEDEVKTIDYLKRGLTEQGYSVDAATDGLDGLHLASTGDYDAIILDIMLPGLDGISLLKSLRPSNNTPVIMLTAKEFSLLEVLAQRQSQIVSKTVITELVWDICFDTNTNVVEATVKRLRAKLEQEGEPKLLHTIRGMGYVLEQR